SKRKSTLAKGGPGFFATHIEKLILAGCLAAVGYLVYAGFSTPGYSTTAIPEELEKDAKELMTKISQDHWEQISADPERKIEHDFASRAAEARRPTDPSNYDNAVWDPQPLGVFEKRGDPKIFPPEQLVVTTVNGSLAIEVPKDEVDPYEELEDAEPIRSKRDRDRDRDSSRGRRGSRGSSGSDDGSGMLGSDYGGDMMGAGGSGMMGTSVDPAKRFLTPDNNMGVLLGGTGMGGMGGMGGFGGRGGDDLIMGAMSMSGGGMGTTGQPIRDGLGNSNKDRGPKTKIGSRAILFNAITAVVPHRKMVEEYLAQFQESGNFVPQRDLPFYMSFKLQRVEVTGNPTREIQENEWKDRSDGLEQSNLPITQKWATRMPPGRPVPEVIDRRSYSPGLTMPIPPILIRDYRQFSKHPAVNWAWDAHKSMLRRPRRISQPPKESTVLPGVARGGSAAGGMGTGGIGPMLGGMMGGGSRGDEMMGGYGGGGYGGGGYGGGGYGGGSRGDDMGGYGGGVMGGYAGGMGGGYGDERGGGMGMMGAMGGMGMSAAAQPEFKMVRCYDMLNPREDYAKVFRYRIRVIMRDPNYPEDRFLPRPPANTLKDDVWARVAPLITKDDAEIKKNPKAMRTLRLTDWSQPSPPARVELPIEVFAGEVVFDGARSFESEGKIYSLTVSEPSGKVVATTMDGATGARFAFEDEVRRGSLLSDKSDVDLIDPKTRVIKVKKDQPIDSRATVVDIRGGKPLAGDSRDDPLKDIGEMLILNRDGSVTVTNEFDDTFLYRMYTFADEHEAAEKSGSNGGSPFGDMMDDGGGGSRDGRR
ncbi:MAG: hypothetical protein KDA72_04070, partial [Planctomycetales bacterium]|nr:hypothetical protein [Planctomycetales bacterium]